MHMWHVLVHIHVYGHGHSHVGATSTHGASVSGATRCAIQSHVHAPAMPARRFTRAGARARAGAGARARAGASGVPLSVFTHLIHQLNVAGTRSCTEQRART